MVTRRFEPCTRAESRTKLAAILGEWGRGDIVSILWIDNEPSGKSPALTGWDIFYIPPQP